MQWQVVWHWVWMQSKIRVLILKRPVRVRDMGSVGRGNLFDGGIVLREWHKS